MLNAQLYNELVNYLSTNPQGDWDWELISKNTGLSVAEIHQIYNDYLIQQDINKELLIEKFNELEEQKKRDEELRQKMEYNKHKQVEIQFKKYKKIEDSLIDEETLKLDEVDYLSLLRKASADAKIKCVDIDLMNNVFSLKPNVLTTIIGNTNVGKTTLTAHITQALLKRAAEENVNILTISLETSQEQATVKALSSLLKISEQLILDVDNFLIYLSTHPEKNELFKAFCKHVKIVGAIARSSSCIMSNANNCAMYINKAIQNDNVKYVIIDYYQAINDGESEEKRSNMIYLIKQLDFFKNEYGTCIILFSQCKPLAQDTDFEISKMGKEELQFYADKSDEILWIQSNNMKYETYISCVKSRSGKKNNEVMVGFDKEKGHYVEHTEDFQIKASTWAEGKTETLSLKQKKNKKLVDDAKIWEL